MSGEVQVALTPVLPLVPGLNFATQPISVFHRIWPVTALAAAVVVNLAWIGLLGYGFFKIAEPAFF
jgi:hypothetical protein